MKFGIRGQLTDIVTYVKFLVDRFRGYGVLTPPKLSFRIDLLRRPYNSVARMYGTAVAYFLYFFTGDFSRAFTEKNTQQFQALNGLKCSTIDNLGS